MRTPSANSNKASMFFELYAFHDGIKCGGEDTFGTSRPFGKSAMIRPNAPNLQIWTKHKSCEHGQPINKIKYTRIS